MDTDTTDRQHRLNNRQPSAPSRQQGNEYLAALTFLTLSKTAKELTQEQAICWLTVLAHYPSDVVREACVYLALGTDPFPDLGKLVRQCRRIEDERSGTIHRAEINYDHPPANLVKIIAKGMQ